MEQTKNGVLVPATMDSKLSITQLPREEIFLHFALTEAAEAIDALDDVERLATVRIERAPGVTVTEHRSILAAVKAGLHSAASASRLVWPPRNKKRGEQMRLLVGVPADHGLRDRRLRDHIEHLDERLDVWTAQSPRSFTSVDSLLRPDMHVRTREALLESTLLLYDVGARQAWVMGEWFDLAKLRHDLVDMRERISAAFLARYKVDEGGDDAAPA